ncbi:MAG: hypothetical protein LV481_16500 [Methylacidiphilales bacterium]|nr:hypothetical protein [Candidatus Methylacidiphilales bacterium]
MRTFALSLTLLLMLPWLIRAQDDGLYWVSDQPTDVSITTLDGQKIFLGKPFTEKIDEATLTSQTNDNTKYQIDLNQNVPYLEWLSLPKFALVLQKKCLLFNICKGDEQHRDYRADLSDTDFISNTEAFFKITRQNRKHPGHQFWARFFASKPEGYPLGEPVVVTLEIMNCGTHSFFIYFPGGERSRLDDSFTFTAFRVTSPVQGKKVETVASQPYNPAPSVDMGARCELKPQKMLYMSVDLKRYLVMDKKGTYLGRGTYAFQLANSYLGNQKVIWDDYATAEFEVTIK